MLAIILPSDVLDNLLRKMRSHTEKGENKQHEVLQKVAQAVGSADCAGNMTALCSGITQVEIERVFQKCKGRGKRLMHELFIEWICD